VLKIAAKLIWIGLSWLDKSIKKMPVRGKGVPAT